MLSVKNLQNTFRSATEETHIEFVLACDGDVMISTLNQMDYEDVFLSSLGRCWKGFDIFENDPLKYQIYTYEQCNAVVVQCCQKYLIVAVANYRIPLGLVKTKLFFLRDFIESEFNKLNST